MAESTDSFWETVLEYIDQGRVIPVVGRELLRLPLESGEISLAMYLAEKLADRFGVSATHLLPTDPIADVLDRVRAGRGDSGEVYRHLNAILKDQLPTPKPLRQLADITHFNLYVTTTFDSLMAQALDESRFDGEHRTRSLACKLKRFEDLDCEMLKLQGPLVYHLFGKVTPMPDEYAVTEEDTLEFLYAMQAGKPPTQLFDELKSQHLLLIGNRFPDWLARFFMRLTRGIRLSQRRGTGELLADELSRKDANLALFLNRVGPPKTAIYSDGGAIEFVDQLHKRYRERHPSGSKATGDATDDLPARPGAVFISYASEDLAAAQTLHDTLAAQKIDAWFDKRQLGVGDHWAAKIKLAIRNCALFVPVISASTEARTDLNDYFRREWNWAVGRLVHTDLPAESTFLAPVVIDATSLHTEKIPPEFHEAQCTRLPGGIATPEFADKVRKRQRDYRSANWGRPV